MRPYDDAPSSPTGAKGRFVGLRTRTLSEFLAHPYEPAEYIVSPWLPRRGIAMVSGWRGLGKSYFALGVAHAIATGGDFLGWPVPEPRKVLYVDGEMDPVEVQQRLADMQRAAEMDRTGDPGLAGANLVILSHADQDLGIPDLAHPEDGLGRHWVAEAAADVLVVVLDNLSSLCRSGDENEAEGWAPMQEWLLGLRRAGKTVLLIHHTGKPGKKGRSDQRGTSKREDILNSSLRLQGTSGEGRFTIETTKARGFLAPAPFGVVVEHERGVCRLRREPDSALVHALIADGKSQKEIARELGISEPTVSRLKHAAAA